MKDLNCTDERRQTVRDQANDSGGLNGIDYVEIIEGGEQRELCVHFFGDVPDDLVPANVRVEGSERVRDVKVIKIEPHRSDDPQHEDYLRVSVDKAGDFSCYKLGLYELEADGDASNEFWKISIRATSARLPVSKLIVRPNLLVEMKMRVRLQRCPNRKSIIRRKITRASGS